MLSLFQAVTLTEGVKQSSSTNYALLKIKTESNIIAFNKNAVNALQHIELNHVLCPLVMIKCRMFECLTQNVTNACHIISLLSVASVRSVFVILVTSPFQ